MRVAVVTGGTRGIGGAISLSLKEAGYHVAAIYHGNEDTAAFFRNRHHISVYKGDVSSFDSCKTVIESIKQDLGPVDILINNAGIIKDVPLRKMSPEQWEDVINTNLNSCFYMSRLVVEGMLERGWGRIINLSSVNALKGQRGQTNYCAAKAGILGFTRAFAQEVASKGVTVNALAPGYINTEMVQSVAGPILEKIVEQIPVGRLGEPEEIARMVVFLVSDAASFITGSTFSMNGGQYMS